MIRHRLLICMTLAVLWAFGTAAVSATPLTAQEDRGRQIYFTGTSSSGRPITAHFGRELIELRGQAAACAGCHGYDGRGRPESGVVPSTITWKYLMKSDGHIHSDGVTHEPFSLPSLKSYLRDGSYPGGKRGDPAMPVYTMTEEDLDALIAFLSILGVRKDPGIAERAIRVGTIIPSDALPGDPGGVIERTLRSYFAAVNRDGGIYNRQVELLVERVPSGSALIGEAVNALLAKDDLFCLLSTLTPGYDRELQALAETKQIPLVGPLTFYPPEGRLPGRYSFYVFPGLTDQVRALASFSHAGLGLDNPEIAIIYPLKKERTWIAENVAALYKDLGWKKVLTLAYEPERFAATEARRHLEKNSIQLALFLGDEQEAISFMAGMAAADRAPLILMPGLLLDKGIEAIPPQLKSGIYLAYPLLPGDSGDFWPEGLIRTGHLPKVAALTAGKMLVEGLRRSGRELSRERFLAALEGLSGFETGLTPPLTYDRNKRIGAAGAYIVVAGRNGKTPAGLSSKGWFSSP